MKETTKEKFKHNSQTTSKLISVGGSLMMTAIECIKTIKGKRMKGEKTEKNELKEKFPFVRKMLIIKSHKNFYCLSFGLLFCYFSLFIYRRSENASTIIKSEFGKA